MGDLLDAMAEVGRLLDGQGLIAYEGIQGVAARLASVGGDLCSIAVVRGDHLQLLGVAQRDGGTDLIERYITRRRWQLAAGFTGAVIEAGRPLRLHAESGMATGEPARPEVLAFMTRFGFGGLEGYPIRAGGRILGVLAFLSRRPIHNSVIEERWMQDLADRLGLALEHDQLRREARARLTRIQALQQVHGAMVGGGDALAVLNTIVRLAISDRVGDAAVILRWDEDRQVLGYLVGSGLRSGLGREGRLRLGEGLAGQAALQRRPVRARATDYAHLVRWSNFLVAEAVVEMAAFPLISSGELTGVLEVFARAPLGDDPESTDFLEIMGRHAATFLLSLGRDSETGVTRIVRGGRSLTATELHLVRLLGQGWSNAQIGADLHLSTSTIRFHLSKLYRQLGVRNRAELAALAIRRGW